MLKMLTQRELRNDNAKVMDAVEAGETFIVTRNGRPVAELRPVSRRRSLVPKDQVLGRAGARIDPDSFRADLDDEIDQSAWR